MFKVGDIVEVVYKGYNFSGYIDFFEENGVPNLDKKFKLGGSLNNGDVLKVEFIGKHRLPNLHPEQILVVSNLQHTQVWIISEDGVKLKEDI